MRFRKTEDGLEKRLANLRPRKKIKKSQIGPDVEVIGETLATFLNDNKPKARLHAGRVAGGHRHHRDFGGAAFARVEHRQRTGKKDWLREQPQTNAACLDRLCR